MRCIACVLLAGCCLNWADAITRRATGPDSRGPCLQIVQPQPRVSHLYRGDELVGGTAPDGFAAAMQDDPESVAAMAEVSHLQHEAGIVGGVGVFGGSFVVLGGIATSRARLAIAGLTTAVISAAASAVLAVKAERLWGRTLVRYNQTHSHC
jgi:hypothetical protein